MKHLINYTPGPSMMYHTVEGHVRQAFREGIPSITHRSKTFERIVMDVEERLSAMLNIPKDFQVYFTASASEIFERSIQNLVGNKSFHLVNGAFSKRYFEFAQMLGKEANLLSADLGSGFDGYIQVPEQTELITVTHNETSTGVHTPLSLIESLRENYPDALISVDAVSSLPYPEFDFSQFDCLLFSVQKCFGLPAGLGVWIVHQRCIEKAVSLQKLDINIGSFHSLPSFQKYGDKHQTPETPNVLGIYLLSKVLEDFLRIGISTIRNETKYKSTLLYQALDQHPHIKAFVEESKWRSDTVIIADCGDHTASLSDYLKTQGILAGSGYGSLKSSQLRFANFPAHSKEQFEALVDAINDWTP